MAFKALFSTLLALFISRAVALDFSNSHWIWHEYATTVPPYAVGDFRYNLNPVHPGHPISAEIIIAGDNSYTLSVNNNHIGTGNDWEIAQEYCVTLNPLFNFFTVEVVNAPGAPPNPAALLAAIEIFYSDGSTQTIVSDNSWLAKAQAASIWTHAFQLGTANTAPWHTPTLPAPAPPLSLANSQWIWTDEPVSGAEGIKPTGSRAFRKVITLPKPATSGTIIISTDNEYTLSINGHNIGTHADWTHAQTYLFNFNIPTVHIIVAVEATNFELEAGVVAALQLKAGCLTFNYHTDNTWQYNIGGIWSSAVDEGLYPVTAPWNTITITPPGPTITI